MPERSLRRSDGALLIDPRAKLIEDRTSVLVSSCTPLLGGIAGACGIPLDPEHSRDDAHAFESDTVAGARGFDESTARVGPTPWPLAARALEEGRDARAVALHGAREVVAEKPPDAVGVAFWRIEERDPARVGPAPHGAVADAIARLGIENRETSRVGPEQAGRAGLLLDESRDRGQEIDCCGDASAERLWRDVDTGAHEARALSLDGLMLDVLVADGFDDESVRELSALDDLRRGRRGDDGVVVGARDGLVEALLDDDAGRDHIEDEAARVPDGGHRRAALRTDAQLRGHAVEHRHARQVRRRFGPPRVPSLSRLLRLGA